MPGTELREQLLAEQRAEAQVEHQSLLLERSVKLWLEVEAEHAEA